MQDPTRQDIKAAPVSTDPQLHLPWEAAELAQIVAPEMPKDATLEERFWAFHKRNPQVYDELLDLARRQVQAGRSRLEINQLFAVLRYRYSLQTEGDDYKLNNDYRACYARLLMGRELQLLGGKFAVRSLRVPVEATALQVGERSYTEKGHSHD